MTNLNTAIRYDASARSNPGIVDLTSSFKGRDNASFLAEVAQRLQAASEQPDASGRRHDPGGVAAIGLIGEYGLLSYGIRRAQELLRVDGTPSYWSHAFLIASPLANTAAGNRSAGSSAWIWESTLEPDTRFSRFSDRNGVAPRRISDYSRAKFDLFHAHCAPNVAVLSISLSPAEREAILQRADDPDVDQLRYDLLGLLGTWFAYLTNRAVHRNPLSEGNGVHSSAYAQLAYDAAGIDLAPGAHQRNTSPEHIWQAARYLWQTFRAPDPNAPTTVERSVIGWFCARDRACVVAPVELASEQSSPRTLRDAVRQSQPRRAVTSDPGRRDFDLS